MALDTDTQATRPEKITAIVRDIYQATVPLHVQRGYPSPRVSEDDLTKHLPIFLYSIAPPTEPAPSPPTGPASEDNIHEAFLASVYRYSAEQKINKAITLVFKQVDSMLRRGEFPQVDRLFVQVDVPSLQPDILLAFLAITHAAKPKLDGSVRFIFATQTLEVMLQSMDNDSAGDLLRKFE